MNIEREEKSGTFFIKSCNKQHFDLKKEVEGKNDFIYTGRRK